MTITSSNGYRLPIDRENLNSVLNEASRKSGNPNFLNSEWDEARSNVGFDAYKYLREAGLDECSLREGIQEIGWSHIKADDESGLYFPDPDGRTAFITPLSVSVMCEGVFIVKDLAAWSPHEPNRIYTRNGSTPISKLPMRMDDEPLQVHGNFMSWLYSGREGVVVVRWHGVAARLKLISEFICRDDAVQRRLEDAFRYPYGHPVIHTVVSYHVD